MFRLKSNEYYYLLWCSKRNGTVRGGHAHKDLTELNDNVLNQAAFDRYLDDGSKKEQLSPGLTHQRGIIGDPDGLARTETTFLQRVRCVAVVLASEHFS